MSFIAALLAGCVREEVLWGHSSATGMDYERDVASCDHDAVVATQTPDSGTGSVSPEARDRAARKRQLFDACMTAKGWKDSVR